MRDSHNKGIAAAVRHKPGRRTAGTAGQRRDTRKPVLDTRPVVAGRMESRSKDKQLAAACTVVRRNKDGSKDRMGNHNSKEQPEKCMG